MKFTIFFLFAFVAVTALHAQPSGNDFPVKVLPSNRPGTIKALYADAVSEDVTVTFLSENGIVRQDKITGKYPKGFLKRYDVSSISDKVFWVEISSPRMSATYRIDPSHKGEPIQAQLAKSTFNQLLVRSDKN